MKAYLSTWLARVVAVGAVLGIFAPVGGRAENNVTTTIDGFTTNLPASYTLGNAGTNNWLIIRNGGIATNTQNAATGTKIGTGTGGNDNHVVVSGPGSMWVLTGTNATLSVSAGASAGCYGNTIALSNGASIVFTTNSYNFSLGTAGASNNIFYMGGLGAVSTGSVAKISVGGGTLAVNNQMIVTNAVLTSSAILVIGTTAISNLVNVNANSLWDFSGLDLEISKGGSVSSVPTTNNYNSLTINAGIVTNVGSVLFGTFSGSKLENSVVITNGGRLYATSFDMGMLGAATNDSVRVVSGGLLEANTLKSGADGANSTNNTIRNEGGIFQFTTTAPTITPGTFGNIAVSNGTISFRNVTNVNVKNNWAKSQLTNMTFAGTGNAFRLDNSSGTNTYWFDAIPGAYTNYAGLDMVNGNTAYTNGNVTIGTNGWLTFSNTTAVLWGAVTNYGRMTFNNNSAVTFTNGLTLQDGTLVWASNATVNVSGAMTLPASMTVSNVSSLGSSDIVTLLTASGGFGSSTPSSWTVYPANCRVTVSGDGKSLMLAPRKSGFLLSVH